MGKAKMSASDAALERVRDIGFGFPGVEEKVSHGSPWFHVRGKGFMTFADDHHGDARLAVWCKSKLERQQELVAEDGERYFVPAYVGPSGWVGVRLDRGDGAFDDLAILAEEAYLSVAPRSVANGPVLPRPPSAPRPKTDPAVASAAWERMVAITAEWPGSTAGRDTWHGSFIVGKKSYAWFLDNHHGDGMVAATFKAAPGENARLVAADPGRYFIPPYTGPRGWLGMRLDRADVDWDELARHLRASYDMVAPKRAPRRK